MNKIKDYFPNLTPQQLQKISQLEEIYTFWNQKINVISRKNIHTFYIQHVLHSLAIAKMIQFAPDTKVMDLGTGGGFPGVPLAIIFPQTQFTLVDSIAKKIKVVKNVIEHIELNNVSAICERAEEIPKKFDFVVTRAVTNLSEIILWTEKKILSQQNNDLPNGWICLKGGDLTKELEEINKTYKQYDIDQFFEEDFFKTKKIVYVKH